MGSSLSKKTPTHRVPETGGNTPNVPKPPTNIGGNVIAGKTPDIGAAGNGYPGITPGRKVTRI